MVSGGKEVEVFWLFKIIAEQDKYYYKGVFDNNFTLVKLFGYFFDQALKTNESEDLLDFFTI